jgi:hypothetical protein
MDKSKIGKYLIYAVGEILLVAIGILLAFQANKWKERENDKKLEKELITNIWYGLQGDLADIKANSEAHNRFLKSQVESVKWIEGETVSKDSIVYNISVAHKSTSFLKSTAPFESLKEFGLNRIENDTLRYYIVYLYDVAYPNFEEIHKKYHQTLDDALDIGLMYYEDWSYEKGVNLMVPVDEKELKNDRKYLMKLKYLKKLNELVLLYNSNLENQVTQTTKLIQRNYGK